MITEKTAAAYRELLMPSPALIETMSRLEGDLLMLGAGGKMGPALLRLAKQAADMAGVRKRIIGVSRFSEPGLREALNREGIETLVADLLEENQLQALPDVSNVIYLAGTKFGTTGREFFTWAMNAYLPGRVAEKYKSSRIVAFSTGNVYPLVTVAGATEELLPQPVGEYAQSCLGRERIFQYFASRNNTPVFIYRLNYANDVSYGVLLEIAKSVMENKPVDLSMGYVNVIWQGDANELAIRALEHCGVPAKIMNITGPETISVRWLAEEFGRMLQVSPRFIHEEQPGSLLSNATESFRVFGYPRITLQQMIRIVAQWLVEGGSILNKPTHFNERKGKY